MTLVPDVSGRCGWCGAYPGGREMALWTWHYTGSVELYRGSTVVFLFVRGETRLERPGGGICCGVVVDTDRSHHGT